MDARHCHINLNLQDYDSFASETHNTTPMITATLDASQWFGY